MTHHTVALKPRQEVNWAEAELCRAQSTHDTYTDRGDRQLTQLSMGEFILKFTTVGSCRALHGLHGFKKRNYVKTKLLTFFKRKCDAQQVEHKSFTNCSVVGTLL